MSIRDRIVLQDEKAGTIIVWRVSHANVYSASAAGVAGERGTWVSPRTWSWWSIERLHEVPLIYPVASLAVEQARRLARGERPLEVWEEAELLAKRSAA